MPPWLQNVLDPFLALSRARQLTLVATAAGSLAFFLWLSTGARTADFRLLYRGLEGAELAEIADGLTAERIEYRLGEGGSAILVPAAQVHEARMRIASRGLPSGGSPGFELFDRGSFGVTDFVQKVNYHRALQGELSRSIEQVEGVEKARVQLAIPERKTLLRKDERKPTASVVTRLRSGWELDPTQVRGIVHLVASSVEGLDVDRVTLVDHRGKLLAPQPDMELGGRGPGPSMGAERRLEAELEQQIESILERTVGLGRVVAKVNAELDWTQTEKTEEIFDPDSQVARSSQLDRETSSEGSVEGGVAGVVANTPDVAPAAGAEGSSNSESSRSSETINYEISKVVSRSVLPVGRIERLSVAVLVDGKPVEAPVAGEGEGVDVEGGGFQPWEAEELNEFEELAKRAVGFSAERGDEISILNAPFLEIEMEDGGGVGLLTPDVIALLTTVLNGLAFLIGLFLFARLFVRPLADAVQGGDSGAVASLREEVMSRLASVGAEALEAGGANAALAPSDLDIPGLEEDSGELTLQQQVDRLAQIRTEDSVRTIRGWMTG
ncbi:MAG: flagellar basal-body MS-ring/collar protein FliF [bacterium]